MKKRNILIFGSDGLMGSYLFEYLKKKERYNVFGTTRRKSNDRKLYFDAENLNNDLKKIIKNIDSIDFAVNCIAEIKENLKNSEYINAKFPHLLNKKLASEKINLIHISSDAVFPEDSGNVNESSVPNPSTLYGKNKLIGELSSSNAITVRSSFLGPGQRGLIWKISNTKGKILLSENYIWSGATTQQFCIFCEFLFQNFDSMVNKSYVYHFAPIGPISRYQVGISINRIFNNAEAKIISTKKPIVSRYLTTKYSKETKIETYDRSIDKALKKLFL